MQFTQVQSRWWIGRGAYGFVVRRVCAHNFIFHFLSVFRMNHVWPFHLFRLCSGLKNDSVPEIFDLRHTTDRGELMPLMYISIIPLLSWGPSFNFSIWLVRRSRSHRNEKSTVSLVSLFFCASRYVELLGQDDPLLVRSSLRHYNTVNTVYLLFDVWMAL